MAGCAVWRGIKVKKAAVNRAGHATEMLRGIQCATLVVWGQPGQTGNRRQTRVE